MSKKKFTIKISEPVRMPADFEEKNWKIAFDAVQSIINKTGEKFSSESVCTSVRLLCDCRTTNYAKKMYDELHRVFERHVSNRFSVLATNEGVQAPSMALRTVVEEWNGMVSSSRTIASLFIYLDCDFVAKHTAEQSIVRLAQKIIGEELSRRDVLSKNALDGFVGAIQEERNGDMVDRNCLAGYRNLSLSLQMYFSTLEPKVLQSTSAFYSHEAQKLVYADCVTAHEYLLAVQQRLGDERDRVQHYLDGQTRTKISAIVQEEMLKKMMTTVVNPDGFSELAKTESFEGLALAFTLLNLRFVDGSDYLRNQFRSFLNNKGSSLMQSKETEDALIAGLIDLRILGASIIQRCFVGDQYRITMADAFEAIIRPKQNKAAELLARYVDSYLKDGGVRCTEQEAEKCLLEAMKVFDFIPSKDMFEAFYARDFAKRLTYQRCASMDNEQLVIRRLGSICGPSLPKKLDGMIRDIELSKEMMTALRESSVGRLHPSIDVSVNVYTQGYWPKYELLHPTLPTEISQAMSKFNTFYSTKHKGRTLSWLESLSTCTVRAQYSRNKKDVSMSFVQSLILLLFNNEDTLTFKEIKTRTNLEGTDDLTCALLSLSVANQKLLLRNSNNSSKAIGDEETFSYNPQFTHKLVRFRINQIQLRESSKEDEETTERVLAERAYVIDAAVVRFMKSRRRSSHSELCGEVGKLLRFPVKVTDIKKRIEVLIEREYLQRDDEDQSMYEYLA